MGVRRAASQRAPRVAFACAFEVPLCWAHSVPVPSLGGFAQLAVPRSVRVGAPVPVPSLGGCAVPRAPLGRTLFVLRGGAGRDSPSSIRHARYDVRVVLLKSIGVCGQRFPPTPSRSRASPRGGWLNPGRADADPLMVGSPWWAPLQGRGELRTDEGRPAPEQRPQGARPKGRGELRTPVRPAQEQVHPGGEPKGREELRTHGRPAHEQVRPPGQTSEAQAKAACGEPRTHERPAPGQVRPAQETPGPRRPGNAKGPVLGRTGPRGGWAGEDR
ncbi:hypothetical protein YW7DRAFT_06441 [Streptomyces sp. AmelKG-E11A]|nr:hypothetical protein YW7DRAFT_06441 [Streptomyces sp. AmelKG-E11A]